MYFFLNRMKGKDIKIPDFDKSSWKYDYDFAHEEIYFQSKQYPMCTNSIFAHQDWKQLHNKAFLSITFKTHGAKLVLKWDIFSRQNIVSLSLT